MVDSDASDATSIDPRVVRTKQRLFDSLLGLIQTKSWDKIRVQDLLDDTGISRSAFYAHFDNKYDLLTSEMPTISVPFSAGAEGTSKPDLLPLFEHVYDATPILRPLLSQPVLSDIIDSFHRQFAHSWRDYLTTSKAHKNDPVLAEMLAGALTALIRSYALDHKREDPVTFTARAASHFDRLLA